MFSTMHAFTAHTKVRIVLIITVVVTLSCAVLGMRYLHTYATNARSTALISSWSSYGNNERRVNFNFGETIINAKTAAQLKLHWFHHVGTIVSDQVVAANSLLYWGSWDGVEHATDLNGNDVWTSNLGTSTASCVKIPNGIGSSATIDTINIAGTPTSVDFVGGGNGQFYALNALTGAIIWQTSLRSSPNDFLWSSPLYYKGSIYEGVAALTDCPVVQGQLVQMNALTGAIQHTFTVVPNGCIGGGVWGSPTLDPITSTIYFATGNPGKCSTQESLAPAVIAVRASDLSLVAAWQVPANQQTFDSDFGSTPTLFPVTVNGVIHQYIGIGNKNGMYYAFDDQNIGAGPVWTDQIAVGGPNPGKGDGVISPAAWNGSYLLVAGGNTTINGQTCLGSLQSINPNNGAFVWQDCFSSGPVIGTVSGVPGIAVVGAGNTMLVVNTASGKTLYTYQAGKSQTFWSGASIVNGVLYITNINGDLYAFGL